jgi:hypothetical protein
VFPWLGLELAELVQAERARAETVKGVLVRVA